MDLLMLLGGLALLAMPIAVITLIFVVKSMARRLSALEAAMRAIRAAASMGGTAAAGPAPKATQSASRAPAPDPLAPGPPGSDPLATGAGAVTAVPPIPVPAAEPPPVPSPETLAAMAAGPWAVAGAADGGERGAGERGAGDRSAGRHGPPKATAARASALGDWLMANWIYAVSALSLAFAGVFFVQYGVEHGLLPPGLRVLAALAFGAVLVGAGEVIRRRSGDGPGATTAYLPSTFAGAGLVGVEVAFGGLLAVAALAVLLGWFYGPYLAAVGLIGAGVAPFVVGGSSDAAYWLYGYFALIAGAGLMIDTVRRWAWVSVLALAVGYGGAWLVLAGTGGAGWMALCLAILAVLAILVPCLGLTPDHAAPTLTETALRRRGLLAGGRAARANFPVQLAGGAVLVTTLGLVLTQGQTPADSLMALFCLAGLVALLIPWSRSAPGIADLTALPALGFVARLAVEGADHWPLATQYAAGAIALRAPEVAAPTTVSLILALALGLSVLAALFSPAAHRAVWAAGAALIAPLAAVVLELFWAPSQVIGAYPWALHVLGLAGVMTLFALRFARADQGDMRRAAYATLSALSLIALALCLIATKGALTLALAALVVAAAWLDRRFRLPEMGWFIQAAVVGISYRLVIDPGLIWAVDEAALWEVIAAYGGASLAMALALWLVSDLGRLPARVFLESGGAAAAALLANVLLTRWLTLDQGGDWMASHWAATLNGMPWLILALVQLYRMRLGGVLGWVRIAIATVAGLLAMLGIGLAAGPLNPLFGLSGPPEGLVRGPLVFDTLMVAYGLPGAVLLAALGRLGTLWRWLRLAIGALGCGLGALYVGLEIRRFWQGDDLSVPGVMQAELYSYTIALMILGAGLLYQALARGDAGLRRAGMAVIGLTVAKVFLLDAAGLSGLVRVASFVGLGLALAGLAWLNRWAAARQG